MFLAKYVFDDVPSNPGKGSGRSDSTGRSSPGLGVIELMRSKTGNPDFENSQLRTLDKTPVCGCMGQFHKTLRIRKLRICSYGQILTRNLLITCKNSVIYGKMTVNYKEKSFMAQAPVTPLPLLLLQQVTSSGDFPRHNKQYACFSNHSMDFAYSNRPHLNSKSLYH